ncbi:MAG TPA: hypothetical protein VNR00_02760 [Opitutus sp.]|nr:hypothetical protein [Opitutus sp.]
MKMPVRPAIGLVAFALAWCAGCSTPRDREFAEAAMSPPVAMAGATRFFDGKVLVSATLGRAARPHPEGSGGRDGSGQRWRRDRPPGGMSGGMMGPAGERRDDDVPTPRVRVAGGPHLTLRVTLKNTSPVPLTIQIRDVNSDLGNFVVRPERVELAPDQTAELEPMSSELGNVVGDIPVQISLRAENKTESNSLVLKPGADALRASREPRVES